MFGKQGRARPPLVCYRLARGGARVQAPLLGWPTLALAGRQLEGASWLAAAATAVA